MRNFLGTGNIKGFTSGLPEPVQPFGAEIFKMLGGVV
jgi:hypothetical protein